MVFPAYAEIDQTLNPAGLVKLIGEVSGNWIEAVCIGTGLAREALPVFEAAVGGLAEMSSDSSGPGLSAYSPEVLN